MPDASYLYRDKLGEFRWRREDAGNHKEVGAASEGYVHKSDAEANYYRMNGDHAPLLEDLTDEEGAES